MKTAALIIHIQCYPPYLSHSTHSSLSFTNPTPLHPIQFHSLKRFFYQSHKSPNITMNESQPSSLQGSTTSQVEFNGDTCHATTVVSGLGVKTDGGVTVFSRPMDIVVYHQGDHGKTFGRSTQGNHCPHSSHVSDLAQTEEPPTMDLGAAATTLYPGRQPIMVLPATKFEDDHVSHYNPRGGFEIHKDCENGTTAHPFIMVKASAYDKNGFCTYDRVPFGPEDGSIVCSVKPSGRGTSRLWAEYPTIRRGEPRDGRYLATDSHQTKALDNLLPSLVKQPSE